MPIVAHLHDWANEGGGFRCIAGAGCTAFFHAFSMQANSPSNSGGGTHHSNIDFNQLINQSWKKSGGN